jgi:16S rRNA (adenine1518-N6/adenine1519-N6)-dimethyltransferase
MPAPKVTSSVIQLRKRSVPVCAVKNEQLMFRVIRAAFNQRRKTLNNALASGFGELTKQDISAAIAECGFDERIRGEALSLEQFALLSDVLAKYLGL